MTGQNDRQTEILSGQIVILAGHCPLTGRYLQPCMSVQLRWQQRGTHCCGHKCFPVCMHMQYLLLRQNCVQHTKTVSDFFQKHYVSATNFSCLACHGIPPLCPPKKHHMQQYHCHCHNYLLSICLFVKVVY